MKMSTTFFNQTHTPKSEPEINLTLLPLTGALATDAIDYGF